MCARVEQTYKVKVTTVLPLSDEMMALASSGIFALKYPDHPISQGLQKVVSEITG